VSSIAFDIRPTIVLASKVLDERAGRQKKLSLASLLKLEPAQCKYAQLAAPITQVSRSP